MDSRYFYKDIPILPSFDLAANGLMHANLPDDWWVVVADVVGSTKAIEDGRYKDVNTVSAATIMAVINVDRSIELPFVFGGDGATMAVPDCMVRGVKSALLGAKSMAKLGFNLDLRIGMLPVKDFIEKGLPIRIAKYQHSEKITQTALSGFGWGWAEAILKDPHSGTRYDVVEDGSIDSVADFTGFQCRWRPVKARDEFKLSIIIQSVLTEAGADQALYISLIREINDIFGAVGEYHPLAEANLGLTLSPRRLWGEAAVFGPTHGPVKATISLLRLISISALASLLFKVHFRIGNVVWGNYKQEVVDNSDFRKFDGVLKMVVDTGSKQEDKLRKALEILRKDGQLVYGLHRSKEAIMTCLVFTPGQDHAHFVDGSDGGYAIAAKELKAQLARRAEAKISF
jgi:Protein of unknown function (DUF3095)